MRVHFSTRNEIKMKSKIMYVALVSLVMLNILITDSDITVSPDYIGEVHEIPTSMSLSQDEEFNMSSYHDFAYAAVDVLVSKLINITDGTVFHAGNANWELIQQLSSLADYYWTILALSRAYEMSNNVTYSIILSRAAERMVDIFLDPIYPGFYVNEYSSFEARTTKRPGIQAYAYWALEAAESVNASLDFTSEKGSALRCLTDILYDPVYGGFYFFVMRNGSLTVPEYFFEIYPNDGKRLDHLVLGAAALYDAGTSMGNSTMIAIAEHAVSFMLIEMKHYYDMTFGGLRLAVARNGGPLVVEEGLRPAHTVVTDINAMAIRTLLKGYELTGNSTYLDTADDVFYALLRDSWDTQSGGWFAETLDGEPFDPTNDKDVKYYKYSEIQFQMVIALERLYEITDSQLFLQLIIDTLDLVLARLWEPVDEGFVRNGNQDWLTPDEEWQIHYTAVQAQAIVALEQIWSYGLPIISNVRVAPTNPRPDDYIDFIAIVLDGDGVDCVYVNCTLNVDGNETIMILELYENSQVGGVYNNSISPLADNCRVNFIVVANDTLGKEFIAGSYFFIVRKDTFAPSITLRAINPANEVKVGDDVIIDMNTYEFPLHSGVYYCELWWYVNQAPFIPVNMTPIGVDGDNVVWRINLGQFHGGDRLTFFARSEDESGNIGESITYQLTILGPPITPISAWQLLTLVGLVSAPGVGYLWARSRKSNYRRAQREGKKAAKRKSRRRGPRRRR